MRRALQADSGKGAMVTAAAKKHCEFDHGWGTCQEEHEEENSPYCKRHQLRTWGGQVATHACGETWGGLVCGRLLADHESCDCRRAGSPL